jgi:5-methylcytosine-specific restriction endonuclease McrA
LPPSNTSLGRHVFRKSHRRLFNSPEPVACVTCGAFFFYDTRANGKVKYCLSCKPKRAVERAARHDTPEKRAERQARRRARSTGPVIRYQDVAHRYGMVCHLCGLGIDMSLRFPNPFSKSFDHVIPLSKGGAHTLNNIKLAHLRCNIRKGNRT